MWLINTHTYTLHEIQGPDEDHPYAILSHTWEESMDNPLQKEVTFRDMSNLYEAQKKTGWAKIGRTCDLARNYEPSLTWVWIDTCCIDKSSSSELSEAINSMFSWYKQAQVCFVYLSDLPQSPTSNLDTHSSREHVNDFLPGCRWFKRGWTLQELIAPSEVEFYDELWTKRGTKTELGSLISRRTGIDRAVLQDSENLATVPVGRKMSWVSDRNTKRVEDIAYCLFGIFDVNMPLIYGEGYKAFIRLQTTIAQQTNDLSLFAWSVDSSDDEHETETQVYYGMFAQSHRHFKCCKHLIALRDPLIYERTYFTVTNRGLEFQTPLLEDENEGDYLMNLFCQSDELELTSGEPGLWVVRLLRTVTGFARHRADKVSVASDVSRTHIWHGKLSSVHVPMVISLSESRRLEARLQNAFRFRIQSPSGMSVQLLCSLGMGDGLHRAWERVPRGSHSWDPVTKTFITGGYPMFTGMIWPIISNNDKSVTWPDAMRLVFGLSPNTAERRQYDFEPAVDLQPWLMLVAPDDPFIQIAGHAVTSIHKELKLTIDNEEAYGPAISALGYTVRQLGYETAHLPKNAILTPSYENPDWYYQMKSENERVKFNVEVQDVRENGVIIHDVVVKIEPIESRITFPVIERTRSQPLPYRAY